MTEDEIKKQTAEAKFILNSEMFAKIWGELKEMYLKEATATDDDKVKLDRLRSIEALDLVKEAVSAKLKAGVVQQMRVEEPV